MVINDSPAALDEFEDSGLDLHDYQQNFIVDEAVKLTFVAPDLEVTVQLRAPDPKHLRVAAVDEGYTAADKSPHAAGHATAL